MITNLKKGNQQNSQAAARHWKVGALARQSGVSVRTLHHYDAIGLLSPAGRDAAEHRIYSAEDVTRLGQIVALRQMGFSLEEIRNCLQQRDFSPERVVQMHIAHLQAKIAREQRLCRQLQAIAARLESGEATPDEFLKLIEVTTMIEKYYTPEQLAQLEARRQQLGEEHIKAAEAEWPQLMAKMQGHLDAGTDPGDPEVQKLATRWMELIEEFTGGDEGIRQSLSAMYENESNVAGMDTAAIRPLYDYVQRALAARS